VGDFSGGLSLLEDTPGDSVRYARTFTAADGLPHAGIRSMAEGPSGILWIGTRQGGIARYDGSRFTAVSQREGLRSNAGWALAVGGDGRVWAGTDFGVEGINPSTLQPFATLEEMQGERILRMGIVADSMLWAATAYAVHLYDLRGDAPNGIPPPVFITSFLVNGEPQEITSGQTFAHDRNTAAIEYIGVSLKDEEAVRYEYRFGGEDVPLRSSGIQRTVTLAGLAPGAYTFAVRARNGDGVWSAAPAMLSFTIMPPVWRTWWFISAVGIAAVGSVVLLVRRRLRALEGARRLQEEFSRRLIESQEQERKRIAAELHDSLGQSLLIIKNKAELGAAGPAGRDGHLQDISDIASRSVAEVREIAHDLRPYLVDKLGLTKGLRSMIRRLADSSGIAFTGEIGEIDAFFPPEQQINFYRILQEATNNVVKHSRATECLVSVEQSDGGLTAVVADNGVGITAPAGPPTENHGGFGLVGIAERVRLLAGTWRIERRPGGGTAVTVQIPNVEKT
jgi:signal transduction histidine kinase